MFTESPALRRSRQEIMKTDEIPQDLSPSFVTKCGRRAIFR